MISSEAVKLRKKCILYEKKHVYLILDKYIQLCTFYIKMQKVKDRRYCY